MRIARRPGACGGPVPPLRIQRPGDLDNPLDTEFVKMQNQQFPIWRRFWNPWGGNVAVLSHWGVQEIWAPRVAPPRLAVAKPER